MAIREVYTPTTSFSSAQSMCVPDLVVWTSRKRPSTNDKPPHPIGVKVIYSCMMSLLWVQYSTRWCSESDIV